MKVLVTGASGFIGGHVVDQLQAEGHDVTALVRPTSDTAHLRKVEARLAVGDVTDAESLRRAAAGQDCVIHTAAIVGTYGRWQDYLEVGVRGTQNMLGAAAANDVARFVHLGSIAVYGTNPRGKAFREEMPYDEQPERWNHYVREKVWSEKRVWRAHEQRKVQVTSIRPSVVLGPRDRATIPRVISNLKSVTGAIVGDGQNRVPCVVVEELAAAITRAATSDTAIGRAYNLSGQRPVTQRALMNAYAEAAGIKPLARSVPEWLAMASGTAAEGVYRLLRRRSEPAVTRIAVVIAGRDYEVDCTRAGAELDWQGSADYFDAVGRSVAWHLGQAG
jgi:nucleoside-diphosphate-sugar epimerase